MRLSTRIEIAAAVATCVATGVLVVAAGQSATTRRVIEGEQLFHSYCAPCHGADGKGHGPAASALKTPPADLTAISAKNSGTFPRARLIRYVAEGEPSIPAHGSKAMPVWGPNFAALDPGSYKSVSRRIEDVVDYLESIQAKK
jgi:mono/diheme cytochrome c family protein